MKSHLLCDQVFTQIKSPEEKWFKWRGHGDCTHGPVFPNSDLDMTHVFRWGCLGKITGGREWDIFEVAFWRSTRWAENQLWLQNRLDFDWTRYGCWEYVLKEGLLSCSFGQTYTHGEWHSMSWWQREYHYKFTVSVRIDFEIQRIPSHFLIPVSCPSF